MSSAAPYVQGESSLGMIGIKVKNTFLDIDSDDDLWCDVPELRRCVTEPPPSSYQRPDTEATLCAKPCGVGEQEDSTADETSTAGTDERAFGHDFALSDTNSSCEPETEPIHLNDTITFDTGDSPQVPLPMMWPTPFNTLMWPMMNPVHPPMMWPYGAGLATMQSCIDSNLCFEKEASTKEAPSKRLGNSKRRFPSLITLAERVQARQRQQLEKHCQMADAGATFKTEASDEAASAEQFAEAAAAVQRRLSAKMPMEALSAKQFVDAAAAVQQRLLAEVSGEAVSVKQFAKAAAAVQQRLSAKLKDKAYLEKAEVQARDTDHETPRSSKHRQNRCASCAVVLKEHYKFCQFCGTSITMVPTSEK